jgi:ribose/xylose/arabinose/galactoside ABC-type transport system permease subunit
VAGAAAVWPAVTDSTGVGLPCPLRALTGVPCPFCGLTTAAIALVRGRVVTAFGANPLIFGLGVLAVAVGPLIVLRALGVLSVPQAWPSRRRRRWGRLAVLVAAASWLFQLHRLGVGRPSLRII